MATTPLFAFNGGPVVGLNGIQQALLFQENQLRLQQAVRDNARDSLTFQSELDGLAQFADFRASGLTPSQALFQTSQGSFNPLTAQAGLNNFTSRSGQLAPLAIESAQGGNLGLFNSVFGNTGVQFDPSNPTSGFSAFGPQGATQQANFGITNNLLGGRLSTPQRATRPLSQPTTQSQQLAYVSPTSPATAQAQQLAYLSPTAQPAVPQQFVPQASFANPGIPQAVQQQIRPQTQIQQNASVVSAIQQATRPNVSDSIINNSRNSRTQRPRAEALEPVTFPTFDSAAEIRRQAERERRRARAQAAVGFNSIFSDI